MVEAWKDIKGYEGRYQVSNLGRIKSTKKGIILVPLQRNHGYKCVSLYGGNPVQAKTVSIHRIVAEAFIPKLDGKNEVNHINEDKADNRAINLEWVNRVENVNHGTRNKRVSSHNTNNVKKCRKIIQCDDSGQIINTFISAYDAERQIGINHKNIYNALYKKHKCNGYYWYFAN